MLGRLINLSEMSLPTVGEVGFVRTSRTRELTPVRVVEISVDERTITVQIIGEETKLVIDPDDFLFVSAKKGDEEGAYGAAEQPQQRAGSAHVETIKREYGSTPPQHSALPTVGTIGFVRTTQNRQLLPISVVRVDEDRRTLSVRVLGDGTLFQIEPDDFLPWSSEIDLEYRSAAPDVMRTVESDVYRRAYNAYADEFDVPRSSPPVSGRAVDDLDDSEGERPGSSPSSPDSDIVRRPVKRRRLSSSSDDSGAAEETAPAEEQIEQQADYEGTAEGEINFNQLQSGNLRNDKYRLRYVRQQLACPDGETPHRRHILIRASQKVKIEGDDCIVCGFCGYETKRMTTFVTHVRRHHEAESRAEYERNLRNGRPEPYYRDEDDDPI